MKADKGGGVMVVAVTGDEGSCYLEVMISCGITNLTEVRNVILMSLLLAPVLLQAVLVQDGWDPNHKESKCSIMMMRLAALLGSTNGSGCAPPFL